MAPEDFRSVLNKRILITGEVNTGKTTAARAILDGLCSLGFSGRIAVIDMAPEIPEEIAIGRGLKGVGGKLVPEGWDDVIYLAATLHPPRLSSKSEDEALTVASENREKADRLFEEFRSSDRDMLFLNDVSMYLQAGSADKLLRYTVPASTLIANGYYGSKLGAGILSARETAEMDRLIAAFPHHLRMPGTPLEEFLRGLRA